MATLKDEQKIYIVRSLARFRSPPEIVADFKEEYGVEIQLQQVKMYDPTRGKFSAGLKWRTLFEAIREDYLKNIDGVHGTHQAYRMNTLQSMLERALKTKNLNQAQSILEQMAKEVGGVLTNQKHVTVDKTGGFRDMEPGERRDRLKDLLREALTSDPQQNAPSSQASQ